MDKAKQQLDDYTLKTANNPHFIAFELLESKNHNPADDLLTNGEQVLGKTEKQKGYPTLNGMESSYN